MKLLFVFASLTLFATTVYAQQFAVGAPAAGSTLTAGQNVNVEILVPVSTSAEGGNPEVALVIGLIGCGTSACPAASADLGDNPLITKFQSQGRIGSDSLTSFENFSLPVPSTLSGAASIQVMHIVLSAFPGHANPVPPQFLSVPVQVGSGPSTLNIHPNGDNTKCVGILGGTYANGTPVDIFDCNLSNTQKWQFNGDALTSVNPADGSKWCLDAGVQSQWANGVKMKIWQCLPNLPQQTWTPITSSGTIALPGGNFCFDLTNGIKTNQNVLQIWTCGAGNPNQLWTVT